MIAITHEEIIQYRQYLSENPHALSALDEIEACEGDLDSAVRVLAINVGMDIVRADRSLLNSLAIKCRDIICKEEFKDELLPDVLREVVAALTGYLIATNALPVILAAPVAIYVVKVGIRKFCDFSPS
ncbi:MAG: hypothetical protein F6K16_34105 [Symploca sp. SIO2B6]|nr:hypothetical protein [Symploca sp. SIO2B6]